jgi:iron(III) transport system permease protein
LLFAVALLTFYPIATVVIASFNEASPGAPARWSLEPWRATLADATTWRVLWNTLLIALPRTLLALVLAASLAWLCARTNLPGRRVLQGALTLLFFLPDLPWIIAWMLMAAPQAGLLNTWVGAQWINVFNLPGLIALGAARVVPTLFLFLYPAFLAMDASLEEAARVAGASAWRTLRAITLPLMKPALLAIFILAFARSMDSFELEQLIGTQAGVYVLTTRIYDLGFSGADVAPGRALVTALLLLALTLGLAGAQLRWLGTTSFTTISGRGFRPHILDLGAWRWLAFGLAWLFVIVTGILPFVVLTLGSLMEVYGFIEWRLFTLRHWREALGSSSVLLSVWNTIRVGVAAATSGVALALAIAYVTRHSRTAWRRALYALAWLPWAIPGLVMGLGFLWAFVAWPIFGTLWLLALVFVARGLPIGTQQFAAALKQLGAELEEAARVHGASWRQTFARVTLPLLKPALLSAWTLIFVMAVRVLDSALILTAAGTRLLSVDIFSYAGGGMMEGAVVLSLLQTAVIIAGYVMARLLLGRSPLESNV